MNSLEPLETVGVYIGSQTFIFLLIDMLLAMVCYWVVVSTLFYVNNIFNLAAHFLLLLLLLLLLLSSFLLLLLLLLLLLCAAVFLVVHSAFAAAVASAVIFTRVIVAEAGKKIESGLKSQHFFDVPHYLEACTSK